MSEEEIKKLSKKLAQTLYDDNTLFFSVSWTNSNPIDCKAYELEKTLEVLLRDYCIVPKVEVLNQHAWYMQRMKEVSSNHQMNRGKAIALENLFGKELFEQKGE